MVKFGFRKARFMFVLALFAVLQGCAVQQLNSAIMSGANPVSNQLIRAAKDDGSLNSIDAHGETPLLKAVALGQVENVRRLLKLGADANRAGRSANTPLCEVAFRSGQLEVARLLLDAGADVDRKNSLGGSPLALAAHTGRLDILRLLISRGAKINQLNGIPPVYSTALLEAAAGGQVDAARALLDAGAEVDLKNGNGLAPLAVAAQLGHTNLVELLISRGAEVGVRNGPPFTTALLEAVNAGQVDAARALLNAGADIERKNLHGLAPLAVAAVFGYSNLVEMLISHGAEVDMMNGRPPSEPALLGAVIKGHLDVVRILLDAGADPNFVHAPTGKRLTDWAREAKAWSVLAELEEAIKRPPVRVARVRERPKEPGLTTLPEPLYTKNPVAPSGDYTRRQALVIGNSRYKGIAALKNATNDARAIRSALSTAADRNYKLRLPHHR